MGARGSYKNFGCLVEAVGSSTWPSQLSVRVAGSEFSRHELKLIRQFGIEDRLECVGRVSDEELCRLYQAAQFFVFPSAAEGFGLPTLESQVNGCLAVVSDLPVFREVAGKGALFFDPWAPETLAQVANTALDEKVREATVRLGNDNVQRFSWDHAAEVTLQCYRELHAKRWA